MLIYKINCIPIKRDGDNVIYYVPHQDDEALGFSLAIAEDIALGNKVKVIIYMPRRSDSGLLNIMRGYDDNNKEVKCSLKETYPDEMFPNHESKHSYNWNLQDIMNIRQQEFERTMKVLGVSKYETTNWGDEQDELINGERKLVANMYNLIGNNERNNPGTIHKCIAGPRDCNPWEGPKPMPDHLACWTAVKQLFNDKNNNNLDLQEERFIFYDNYVWFDKVSNQNEYYAFTNHPKAPQSFRDLSKYSEARINTDYVYRQWDPNNGKYALGYHSVHNLFLGSLFDYNVYYENLNSADSDFNDINSNYDSNICIIQDSDQSSKNIAVHFPNH